MHWIFPKVLMGHIVFPAAAPLNIQFLKGNLYGSLQFDLSAEGNFLTRRLVDSDLR